MLRWLFGKKSGTEHTKAQAASHERNIDNQAPTETRQSSLGAHPPHGDSKSGTFPQSSLANTTDDSTHPTASARILVKGQDDAEVHYSRGKRLLEDDQFENAIASLLDALRCKPDFPEAHFRLGKCWQGLGKPDKAMASYLEAVRINPAYAEAHNNLGVLHHELGDAQHAINYYQRAVDLKPELAPAHFNLALLQLGKGKIDDAIQSFRRLFEVDPDFPDAHTNLLFYLSHDTTQSPQTVFDAHRAYADRVEAPLRPAWPTHRNLRDPRRTLRLGFVSADLRAHAVASFIEPLWLALDKSQFEIWVYSNHAAEDEVTKRLRNTSRNWRNVVNFSDADLVAAIQQDGIDILFDLSGHTFGNRLRAFAHKPAPIQVTWIGNPNTTGLQAMDYYLADRFSAPPGLLDSLFTEKIVRLPSGVLFQPFEQSPDVNSLPALSSNRMTFGSFSRGDKLVGEVAALWACVLAAVPGSQMLVGGVTADQQAHVAEQFSAHNVEASRLIFVPRSNMADYLAAHHRVDLILDTFPFNGGTTSCHAAWMGVPVLTIAGKTMASRVGVIINSNLGLFDFIAESNDDFVAKAQSWASRHQELAKLRSELRGRMAASPFCQPQRVTRWVETALRTMWQRWCAGEPPASFEVPE